MLSSLKIHEDFSKFQSESEEARKIEKFHEI